MPLKVGRSSAFCWSASLH